MGGFGAEPGTSSTFEDEDGERYDDDYDDFEEPKAESSSAKQQPQGAGGQVYPLETVSGVPKPAIVLTKSDPTNDGDVGGEEGDGGGRYSDDDFEDEKGALSAAKEGTTVLSDTLRAKSEDRVPSATPVGKSADEYDDDDNDDNAVGTASEAATPAREQAARLGSEDDVVKTEVDLVSIHAHRGDTAMLPPLAPLGAAANTASQRATNTEAELKHLCRLSGERAAIAAKRVVEYRELQARSEAQQTAEAAAIKKKREQFRASNRKIYEQMGVSNLNGDQRYLLLVEENKLLKQHRVAREKLEKHQRWYNTRAAERNSSQTCVTPGHIAQLQAHSKETSRQRYRDTVGRDQIIKTQQAALHKQATAIVAKHTHREYVRGSYLLKKTLKQQPQNTAKPQRESPTNSNNSTQSPEIPTEATKTVAIEPVETPQSIEAALAK